MTKANETTAQINNCKCGCGAEVNKNYRPGHDARHVTNLVNELFDRSPEWEFSVEIFDKIIQELQDQLPTERLANKFTNAAERKLFSRYQSNEAKFARGVKDAQHDMDWNPHDANF